MVKVFDEMGFEEMDERKFKIDTCTTGSFLIVISSTTVYSEIC